MRGSNRLPQLDQGLRSAVRVRALGVYGFGAVAHLLVQLAHLERTGGLRNSRGGAIWPLRALALQLGCAWAGASDERAPVELDAAIIFAPAGELVPDALKAVRKGGIVICGGIHMSDIPAFPYAILWEERRLASVANLTREDARRYLPRAAKAGVRTQITTYPLMDANRALDDLRGTARSSAPRS